MLLRWHALILQHQAELAALISQEQGKPQPKAQAKSPTVPAISSGLPKKANGFMAR
jgi:acyl-CoA reductase-like NAD-dependent aldehyde dehydrogenase